MSIQDIIIAVILVILCITFTIFIIAEIFRDGKRVAKHWKDEEDKDDSFK
jgi:preprotein translocase subunit SecY